MWEAVVGKAPLTVSVRATKTGNGFIVHLLGGTAPHIGAVVLSVPRPSLTGDGSTSCTTSVLPLLGHKDDLPAKPLAEALVRATGQPVVVVAGIHVPGATPDQLLQIEENVRALTGKLLAHLDEQL